MRNLNPHSGLKQLITGSYSVVRSEVLDLARKHQLSALEIGYFIIFLTSADWDPDKDRFGLVRNDLNKLAKAWNIPTSTFRDNLKRLIQKQVITLRVDGVPKIVNFENYTYSKSSELAKKRYSDEFIENYFENSFSKTENSSLENEISLNLKLIPSLPFKDSIKNDLIASSSESKAIKTVMLHQEVRSDAEYQSIYQEGNWGAFTTDDMKWVDQNTRWSVVVRDLDHESQIISTYFSGDPEKYKNCLIT